MSLYQNTVGSNLYVWSSKRASPSANECIITAHGASRLIGNGLSGLDVELVYYTPHGTSLDDPTLQKLIIGAVKPAERIRTKEKISHDYMLGKYSNSQASGGRQHNSNGESYESIAGLPDTLAAKGKHITDTLATFGNIRAKSPELQRKITELELEARQYTQYAPHDVITIRNRGHRTLFNPVTLSEVIRTLQHYGYNYSVFHCSFCRN